MPISALFVIFDFVIHNPAHSETERNLALLDQVAGYLTLLDIASGGALPCSIMSQFAGIAKQYVDKVSERNHNSNNSNNNNNSTITTIMQKDTTPFEFYLNPKLPNGGEDAVTKWPTDINFNDFSVRKHPIQFF